MYVYVLILMSLLRSLLGNDNTELSIWMMHILLKLILWSRLLPLVCSYKIWSAFLKAEIKRLCNTVNLWLLLIATLFRWPNIIEAPSYSRPLHLEFVAHYKWVHFSVAQQCSTINLFYFIKVIRSSLIT